MDTFTQPKITGYRQLNETEAALMNEIKAQGVALDALVLKIADYTNRQLGDASRLTLDGNDATEERRMQAAEPRRWISIARTDFQTALMALTRAVAQPTTF